MKFVVRYHCVSVPLSKSSFKSAGSRGAAALGIGVALPVGTVVALGADVALTVGAVVELGTGVELAGLVAVTLLVGAADLPGIP